MIAVLQRSFASITKYAACLKIFRKGDHKVGVSQLERNLHGDEQSGNWLRRFEERISTFKIHSSAGFVDRRQSKRFIKLTIKILIHMHKPMRKVLPSVGDEDSQSELCQRHQQIIYRLCGD